jgi:hypothetical protein
MSYNSLSLYLVDYISPHVGRFFTSSTIIFSTGTSLPQRWMLLFTQGLTGVFRQADETFITHSTHTRRYSIIYLTANFFNSQLKTEFTTESLLGLSNLDFVE